MFLDHTQRRTTVGRTPLDERSACRRDLYLTTHDTHNRQITMPLVGVEPTISAGEWPHCDELIARSEESYRLWCVVVCDLETSRICTPYIYDISTQRVKERIELYVYSPLWTFVACSTVNFTFTLPTLSSRKKCYSPIRLEGEGDLNRFEADNLLVSAHHEYPLIPKSVGKSCLN
jgi:hypothetical protein